MRRGSLGLEGLQRWRRPLSEAKRRLQGCGVGRCPHSGKSPLGQPSRPLTSGVQLSPPQSLSSADPTLDSGGARVGGGPCLEGVRGERAEGNRRKGSPVSASSTQKKAGRAGGKWRGPRAPGEIGGGWGPGSQASRGAGDPGEAKPPSPVAGVAFVGSDVPTRPLTLRLNDRGRLLAPPGLGCHLRKMGHLPPRRAAPRGRGDGGPGGRRRG